MEKTVSAYLKHLKIPVSRTYVEKLILSHPDYPSLLSITDTLDRLGIQQKVSRVEKAELSMVPFPCLLHTTVCGGDLVYLKDQQELEARQSEVEKWDGLLFQVLPTTVLTDKQHQEQLSDDTFRWRLAGALLLSVTALMVFSVFQLLSWFYAALLLSAILGTGIGYLLFAKELGVNYEAVEAFCRGGTKSSCDRILLSKDAKLFGRITFSDMTLSYFVFQLMMISVMLPFFTDGDSWLLVLAGLSMAALPVVLYSLYYQAVKAKTWCRLCLIVDGLLVVQAGIFGASYVTGTVPTSAMGIMPVIYSVGLLLAIGSIVVLFKNGSEKITRYEQEEITANRIKYSPSIFSHFLFQQKRVDAGLFDDELIIGDRSTPVSILMAANLFCAPCRAKVATVLQLIDTYPDKLHLVLRFTPSQDEHQMSRYLLSYWLTHIKGGKDELVKTRNLIRDWYEWMDTERFMKQYVLQGNDDQVAIEQLESRHVEWLKKEQIEKTPQFFINGYEFPEEYHLEDLLAVVPGIADYFVNKSSETNVRQEGIQVIL